MIRICSICISHIRHACSALFYARAESGDPRGFFLGKTAPAAKRNIWLPMTQWRSIRGSTARMTTHSWYNPC